MLCNSKPNFTLFALELQIVPVTCCMMPYSFYNVITSALGSYVFQRNMRFIGVHSMNSRKFFSVTYRLAKLCKHSL